VGTKKTLAIICSFDITTRTKFKKKKKFMIDEAALAQLLFQTNNHEMSVFPLMLIIRKQIYACM